MTNAFFDKKCDEVTFIPTTINYTRTLEDNSFPGELTGQAKVKESTSRILKAANVFKMNFGSIYVDFFEPIHMSEAVAQMRLAKP